jgi:hypothetical protein
MHHQKVHRDANHPGIVHDLKKMGYSVGDLAMVGGSFPDIIVADPATTALIEIKMRGGAFRLGQLMFLASWQGVAGFAETTDDVVRLMRRPDEFSLTWAEKQMITTICINLAVEKQKAKDPQVLVTKFEKLFRAAGGRL